MSSADIPHRFRLIIECDIEITDIVALKAAQLYDSVNEDGELTLQLPTDSRWFLVGTPLQEAVMKAGNETAGLQIHSASSVPRVPAEDGSYEPITMPGYPAP